MTYNLYHALSGLAFWQLYTASPLRHDQARAVICPTVAGHV